MFSPPVVQSPPALLCYRFWRRHSSLILLPGIMEHCRLGCAYSYPQSYLFPMRWWQAPPEAFAGDGSRSTRCCRLL